MNNVDNNHRDMLKQLLQDFSLIPKKGQMLDSYPELNDRQRRQIMSLLVELIQLPSLTNERIAQTRNLIDRIKTKELDDDEFHSETQPILQPELNRDQIDYLIDISSLLLFTSDLANEHSTPSQRLPQRNISLAQSVAFVAQHQHTIQATTDPALIALYGLVCPSQAGGYAAVVRRNEGNRRNMPDFNPYDGHAFIDQVNKIDTTFGDPLALEAKAAQIYIMRPGLYDSYYERLTDRPYQYTREHTPESVATKSKLPWDIPNCIPDIYKDRD